MSYRRKRSIAGEVLADTSFIANRLSWKGSLFLGIVLFTIFYWVLPAWVHHQLQSLQGNMFRPIVELIFAKRVHWLQWIGIAAALICAFYSVYNYFTFERLSRSAERDVSFLSRLLARWID